MAGKVQAGAMVIQMHADDHVATALKDLKAGDRVTYSFSGEPIELQLLEDIPFGHKVAIVSIEGGTHVRKYGEVIGRATAAIEAGRHVHVHNLEGLRGRGDRPGKGGQE